MIRLSRPSLSDAATNRLVARRDELLQLLADNAEIPSRLLRYYRTATEIKPALRSASSGKCIYCESFVGHVYFGDVEHILPSHHFPELRLTYENLGYSCAVCNNNKLDHFDPASPLIDPFKEDPLEHIDARGPSLRPLTTKGDATITVLDLNRPDLLVRRHESFAQIDRLVSAYQSETSNGKKAVLATQLRREWDASKEFSMVRQNHIRTETDVGP